MDDKIAVVAMTAILGGIAVVITLIRTIAARYRVADSPRGTAELTARVEARLETLQASIDTMALEVERIAEGQRFTTKLLSERGAPAIQAPASDQR